MILSQGIDREIAELCQGFASPRPNSAGDDSNAAQSGQRPSFKVLSGYVLERLPTGQDINSIADFGVAGDRADLRVGEPANQLADRAGFELRIGVERDHDRPFGLTQTGIDRVCFAAVRDRQQSHPRFAGKCGGDDL